MQTPDVIYLIDMGDEVTWCDDANPSGEIPRDDIVRYQKSNFACCLCKNWKAGEYDTGECRVNMGIKAEFTVEAGWNGGYVSKVETDSDFFCAAFEKCDES